VAETVVKGLSELQAFLDQLPAKVERNIARGALRAGMNVVKVAAQANVHSVSGLLAKGLKVSSRARGGLVTSSLKAAGPHGYIAKFVEYGTAAHWISVKDMVRPSRMTRHGAKTFAVRTLNKMARRGSLVIGGNFVGASVAHPGASKKPFMRPALDQKANAAVVAVGNYIKNRLATKEGLDTSGITIEGDDQ
jgi:HK97 gp10 family phage protein